MVLVGIERDRLKHLFVSSSPVPRTTKKPWNYWVLRLFLLPKTAFCSTIPFSKSTQPRIRRSGPPSRKQGKRSTVRVISYLLPFRRSKSWAACWPVGGWISFLTILGRTHAAVGSYRIWPSRNSANEEGGVSRLAAECAPNDKRQVMVCRKTYRIFAFFGMI